MFRTQNNRVESEHLEKRVVKFYNGAAKKDKKRTWLHFKEDGVPQTTVYRYITRYGESGKVEFKKSPGPTPTIATPERLKALPGGSLLFRWCYGQEVQNGSKIFEQSESA